MTASPAGRAQTFYTTDTAVKITERIKLEKLLMMAVASLLIENQELRGRKKYAI